METGVSFTFLLEGDFGEVDPAHGWCALAPTPFLYLWPKGREYGSVLLLTY